VFKGNASLWILFASDPRTHAPHEDVIVGGPATVVIAPPEAGGAVIFVTYQRGSD
jgi:hypothetical protein